MGGPVLEYKSPEDPQIRPQNLPAGTSLLLALVMPFAIITGVSIGGTAGGCFWKLGPIASAAAIAFGVAGLRRAREIDGEGAATAKWGIGLGVVGTTTTILLLAVVVFSLNSAYERANRVKCASNLRQIHEAVRAYAEVNGGALPQRFDQLLDRLRSDCFVCPSSNDAAASTAGAGELATNLAKPEHCSYVYLGNGLSWPLGADVVIAHEDLENHEGGGVHVLFGDGVVKWYSAEEAEALLKASKAPASGPAR